MYDTGGLPEHDFVCCTESVLKDQKAPSHEQLIRPPILALNSVMRERHKGKVEPAIMLAFSDPTASCRGWDYI